MKIFRGILGLTFLLINIGDAKLDEQFRANFPNIVQDLCFSKITYSVDDSVGLQFDEERYEFVCEDGKCREFHDTMQCLFQEAFSSAVSEIKKTVGESVTEDSIEQAFSQHNIAPPGQNCRGKSLGDIQNRQTQQGFESNCIGSPHLERSYSPCRVAETTLLEWCGYQKFLAVKTTDFQSYKAETNPSSRIVDVPNIVKQAYQNESTKTISTLNQMLENYRQFEQKYRLYAWLEGLYREFFPLHAKVMKFWENMALFPDKFVNPSRDA